MSDVQVQLAAGNYVAAIQDELGNMGASATLSQQGVTVTGTVGVLPSSAKPSSYASQPAAVVSLSPTAQNMLSDAQIALDIITMSRRKNGETPTSASSQSNSTIEKGGSADQAPALAQPNTGEVISSPSDPTISDIVRQAQSDLLGDPTKTFYKLVNDAGGPEQYSAYMGNEEDQRSFIQAFNDRTLIVQNAADVEGLDYQDHTVLTGTSETCGGSMNAAFIRDQMAAGYNAGVVGLAMIGGIYIAWKDPAVAALVTSVSETSGGS